MLVVNQNYPNPFSDATAIPVMLAEPGSLEITIYDVNGHMLGRSVQDGIQGLQEVTIKGSDLGACGVVVARIVSNGESATIRMVVSH